MPCLGFNMTSCNLFRLQHHRSSSSMAQYVPCTVALSQPYAFFRIVVASCKSSSFLQLPKASYSFYRSRSSSLPQRAPLEPHSWATLRNVQELYHGITLTRLTHIPFSASPFPPVRGFVHTGALDALKSLVQALLRPATGPFSGASLAP